MSCGYWRGKNISCALADFFKTKASHLWGQFSVPGIKAINIKCICKCGAHPSVRFSSSPDHACPLFSRKKWESKRSFLPQSRRNGPRWCACACIGSGVQFLLGLNEAEPLCRFRGCQIATEYTSSRLLSKAGHSLTVRRVIVSWSYHVTRNHSCINSFIHQQYFIVVWGANHETVHAHTHNHTFRHTYGQFRGDNQATYMWGRTRRKASQT